MRSKIIIYGGSSLISKYLFFEFYKDDYEFIVFCRDKKKVILHIENLNLHSVTDINNWLSTNPERPQSSGVFPR